jgi:hypothetical protein
MGQEMPWTQRDREEAAKRKAQCPAVTYGWCQAPYTCAQPCTGRGGNSFAKEPAHD